MHAGVLSALITGKAIEQVSHRSRIHGIGGAGRALKRRRKTRLALHLDDGRTWDRTRDLPRVKCARRTPPVAA